ncbi:MAG TPA: hypothetical protein VME68_00460 [Acidobacteriaceae bacterium]|nr:hypothetical protein [Acidobacteriaceae bacterium]
MSRRRLSDDPNARRILSIREEQDSVWEAMAGPVRQTGTGPVRLADWLPVPAPPPGPVLVPTPARRAAEEPKPAARPWTWIETLILGACAIVVAAGIAWHEPWADEAQAWLLARDSSFRNLMLHGLHFEGSPGLWHVLLWLLVRMHVSYMGMHWIGGAIALAGMAVLLRYAPFPLILRVLLPFGFWFSYQDAVVARSYVLFAVLAFSAAALLRGMAQWEAPAALRWPRLLGLAAILGLMANVSVHGFVASVGFALAALLLLRRRIHAAQAVALAGPALLLACLWGFAVFTAAPASQVSFAAGTNVRESVLRVRALAGDTHARAQIAALKAEETEARPGELAPIPPLQEHWTPREARWRKIARVLSLITYPVSQFRVLALVACCLVILQAFVFRARKSAGPLGFASLLPWLLMVAVFSSMYFAPRHAGMLWTAFIAAAWLAWPADDSVSRATVWLRHATVAALVAVALGQIWWTAHSVWADVHQPYSSNRATARFLRDHEPGKRIAGFYYYTVGTSAWFRRPVFFNQPHTWWPWSSQVRTVQQAPATIATHPDVIVVAGMEPGMRDAAITDDWIVRDPAEAYRVPLNDIYQVIPYAEAHGYRETHRFCGESFMRASYAEQLCEVVLEPKR